MKTVIEDINFALPQRSVDNSELARENPDWDPVLLEQHTGVARRYIARKDETALDLALQACEGLRSRAKEKWAAIDALLFCTQSADYVLPSNASVLHHRLGLAEKVMAFDFNLACSGYVYGLALARALISSQAAKQVLLVNADTYSKYIQPRDRSVRALFGDGAAVSLIGSSDEGLSVQDTMCATQGRYFDKFMVKEGHICMDGMAILAFVNAKVPQQVKEILKRNQLGLQDVDLYIFHQASRLALDSLMASLGIGKEKVFENLNTVGNTVSASIPIALKEAMLAGKVKRGDRVLLCGFGAGLSWASALLKF